MIPGLPGISGGAGGLSFSDSGPVTSGDIRQSFGGIAASPLRPKLVSDTAALALVAAVVVVAALMLARRRG